MPDAGRLLELFHAWSPTRQRASASWSPTRRSRTGSAGVFTKLYLADISRKFRSGTLRGNTEYAMTLAPLLDASTAIQAHAFVAMAAFALGVVQQDGLSCQSHAKSASG